MIIVGVSACFEINPKIAADGVNIELEADLSTTIQLQKPHTVSTSRRAETIITGSRPAQPSVPNRAFVHSKRQVKRQA